MPHQNIVTPTVFAQYKYLSVQYRSTVVGIGAFYKGKKVPLKKKKSVTTIATLPLETVAN